MRKGIFLLAATVLALLLASGVAYAALIEGTTGDDKSLEGTPKADTIYGYEGRDNLFGYGGPDTLDGGPGNDQLKGVDGGDLLLGGVGRDRIFGQKGADRVNGGSGVDNIMVDAPVRDRVDVVKCGYGFDFVFANEEDRVSRNCERVSIR